MIFAGRAGLQLKAMAAASALLAIAACFVPPDIEAPPLEENVGPVIEQSKVDPQGPLIYIDDSCVQRFTVGGIVDANTSDTIYYRWYVDYQAWDPGRVNESGTIPPPAIPEMGRAGPSFTLYASSSTLLQNRSNGSVHTLEFVAADRPFVEDSSVAPAYKVISEGGFGASFEWTVVIKSDECAKQP
ncbi:MAG: hypothetical protein HY897_07520 [Deltaproteobacteria bacterium]|nr:hypothetical protein [Deltaproteobacteria bacterium]